MGRGSGGVYPSETGALGMEADAYEVIVYGTVCLDGIWRVDNLPPLNGYVDVREARQRIGGEASNTAMAR